MTNVYDRFAEPVDIAEYEWQRTQGTSQFIDRLLDHIYKHPHLVSRTIHFRKRYFRIGRLLILPRDWFALLKSFFWPFSMSLGPKPLCAILVIWLFIVFHVLLAGYTILSLNSWQSENLPSVLELVWPTLTYLALAVIYATQRSLIAVANPKHCDGRRLHSLSFYKTSTHVPDVGLLLRGDAQYQDPLPCVSASV
mmetsp:Transcript_34983/g.88044  ORF Transcript_34983/g.88044 Transcript_34983/m.88044 type:complete len:195 (+) Transcript_34983:49-633(+)